MTVSSSANPISLDRVFPILAVADLAAAVVYYTDVLGFHEAWRWGDPPARVGVARDRVELQLVQAGTPGAPVGDAVVYCHVRGVDALYAECTTRGADICMPLADRGFGLRDFRVRDLDGNILGFGEPITLTRSSSKSEDTMTRRDGENLSEMLNQHGGALRVATAADIPAIFAVRTSVRENHLDLDGLAERGVTPASVAGMLDEAQARTWVVEERGEVVAFSVANAQAGTVFALFVHPKAEGRGYGPALLRAAEEWLFAAGWEVIWLNTGQEPHLRAHRVYRTAGWELVGPADHGDVRYEKRRAT